MDEKPDSSEGEDDEPITPDDLITQFIPPKQHTQERGPPCFEFQTFHKVELESTLGRARNSMNFASPPEHDSTTPDLSLQTPDNRSKQVRPALQSTPITSRIEVKPSLISHISKRGSRTPDLFNYWTPTSSTHDQNKISKTP